MGPESASAHPGPVCYRKGGYPAITDANLVLGRILPEVFPNIFGPNEDQPLDADAARKALEQLAKEVNEGSPGQPAKSVDEVLQKPFSGLHICKMAQGGLLTSASETPELRRDH